MRHRGIDVELFDTESPHSFLTKRCMEQLLWITYSTNRFSISLLRIFFFKNACHFDLCAGVRFHL